MPENLHTKTRFTIKHGLRQLFICGGTLALLYGYYLTEYGLVITNFLATIGFPKLFVHLIVLPIFTTALQLGLSGKAASGQFWFIILTWIVAAWLVFSLIGQPFMAIICLMSALISFVLIKSGLTYYWANEVQKTKIREAVKKHLPYVIRRIDH